MTHAITEETRSALVDALDNNRIILPEYRPDTDVYSMILSNIVKISEVLGECTIIPDGKTEFVKEEAPVIEAPKPKKSKVKKEDATPSYAYRPAYAEAIGLDAYNQASTGEVAMTITAKRSDADHVPVVADPAPAEEPAPVVEEPAPVVEEVKPEPVKEEPKPVEPKTYSKGEVRAALGKARLEKGIDINAIIESIGYKMFGEVPASKFGELMEAINNA